MAESDSGKQMRAAVGSGGRVRRGWGERVPPSRDRGERRGVGRSADPARNKRRAILTTGKCPIEVAGWGRGEQVGSDSACGSDSAWQSQSQWIRTYGNRVCCIKVGRRLPGSSLRSQVTATVIGARPAAWRHPRGRRASLGLPVPGLTRTLGIRVGPADCDWQ